MNTSQHWFNHFQNNLTIQRVDWNLQPSLTQEERKNILSSLQAWQLGETSEGTHLMRAAMKYSKKIGDCDYPKAVELFIREEQKHGNNLGKYLDLIGEKRISKNWGDTLFRKIRYLNSSMELWTLAVITVESTAQIFYQSLKDATNCTLLKQICTDILIDEAKHIEFQQERLLIINEHKNAISKFIEYYFYVFFYFSTISVVWFAHKAVFKAGGLTFTSYLKKMTLKFYKTIYRIKHQQQMATSKTIY